MKYHRSTQPPQNQSPLLKSITDFYNKKNSSPQILRSNEYFRVYYQPQSLKSFPTSLRIELTGLANPYLSLIQIYKLLNPFDTATLSQLQNGNGEQEQSPIKQSSPKLIEGQSKRRTRSHSQSKDPMNSQTLIDNVDKQVHGLESVSPKVTNKKQQQTKTSNKPHTQQKYSLQFLYYIKKVINSMWKQFNQQQHQLQMDFYTYLKQLLTQSIKNYNQHQKIHTKTINQTYINSQVTNQQLKTIKHTSVDRLLKVLKIQPNISFSLQINKHKDYEHFLLYKLYRQYGITNKWTNKYEQQLNQPKVQCMQRFKYLLKFNTQLNHINNTSENNKQLQNMFDIYSINLSELDNAHQQSNNQSLILPTSLQVINFIISNLHRYHYQSFDKKVKIINSLQSTSLLHLKLTILESDQSFSIVTNQHGLINSLTERNEIVYLYQLQNPQSIFNNSPLQLFQKLIPPILQYFQLLNLTKDPQIAIKKTLLPISRKTLIWNHQQQSIELDKLEVWKLLFGLQNNPTTIQMNIASMKEHNRASTSSYIENILTQIYFQQQQDIFIFQKTLPSGNQQSPANNSYLLMIPFIKSLIVAYDIFTQSADSFLIEVRNLCGKVTDKQNLIQLMIKLKQQMINKNKRIISKVNNSQNKTQLESKQLHTLQNYMNQLAYGVNSSQKHQQLIDQFILQESQCINPNAANPIPQPQPQSHNM